MNCFNKSVLVVHAHPDDTEAFCAGALTLLKDRGYKITIATMTAGGMGGIGSTEEETIIRRKEEAMGAAEVLGADYYCLDGRDGYLYDTPELRTSVVSLIRRVKAGIVMTHLPNDYHSDHRATSRITEAASMISSLPNVPSEEPPLEITPLLYHTAPLGFSDPLGGPVIPPTFALDIGTAMNVRREMLSCHQSQIELMRVMHKMDNFFDEMEKYNRELGIWSGCEFAEIYWQHLGGGFQKVPLLQTELSEYIKPFRKET
jgi:LmbE family N-acetylglucosaminyl deacetylase